MQSLSNSFFQVHVYSERNDVYDVMLNQVGVEATLYEIN